MVGIIENTTPRADVRVMLNNLLVPVPVVASDSFTVSETHRNKRVIASKSTTLTVTLPNSLQAGFATIISHEGTGAQVHFVAASGATIQSQGDFTATTGRYSTVSAWVKENSGSAIWQLDGALIFLDAPQLTNEAALPGGVAGQLFITVTTTKADGTIYYVVTASETQPTAAQIIAGDDHTGAAADASGTMAVSARGQKDGTATGVTSSVDRQVHFVHVDAQTNVSNIVSSDFVQAP